MVLLSCGTSTYVKYPLGHKYFVERRLAEALEGNIYHVDIQNSKYSFRNNENQMYSVCPERILCDRAYLVVDMNLMSTANTEIC